jgi:hypothetical protein
MDKVATARETDVFLAQMDALCAKTPKNKSTESIPFRGRLYHSEYSRVYQRERSGEKWSIVLSA